jgi:hypothetical protein
MVYDNSERHEKKELNYVTDEGLNIPILFEALMVKNMGKTLDLIRISDISDRQMTQISRTIKDSCYETIKFAKAILKEHGTE